jgi:hypothetical protein
MLLDDEEQFAAVGRASHRDRAIKLEVGKGDFSLVLGRTL